MSSFDNGLSARAHELIHMQIDSSKSPGIQYLVVDKDRSLIDFAAGYADISAGRVLEPSTTMMIYSMSKTITAAAVLQLVEKGQIALDNLVSKFIDDIPYGNRVTIRQLLSQTSGIRNPIPLKWVHLAEEHEQFVEAPAFNKIISQNSKLDFIPGTKYAYSNISYWLLGHVIERVSGVCFESYVHQEIFRKLDIPVAEIDFAIPSKENHAKGYLPKWSLLNLAKRFLIDSRFIGNYEDGWLHVRDHYLNGASFGGVVASSHAIGKFLQDLFQADSKLFSKHTKELFFEQQRDNKGQFINMTLGWHIGDYKGIRYYFKEGGGGGFHCEMRVYLKRGMASLVMANNTTFDAKSFLNAADNPFLSAQH